MCIRDRLLREHGGIWLDTDIEIIKNLDPLLELPAFMSFESDTLLHTGIVGSEKGAAWTDEYWKYMKMCIRDRYMYCPSSPTRRMRLLRR